jgi:hypothetical protein
MAIPKSTKERILRKIRRKKVTPREASANGKVVPKKSANNDPIPKYRQVEEALDALKSGISPRTIIEGLDEQIVKPLRDAVSRLMLMQFNGWSIQDGKLIHKTGVDMTASPLMELKDGRIVSKKTGKLFEFCSGDKLYELLRSLDTTQRVLDMERKLDLFIGVKDMTHAR